MRFKNYCRALLLVMMALTMANMSAGNVDAVAAQAKAVKFLNSQPETRFMASNANLILTHAEKSSVDPRLNAFYVFNYEKGGYVIISGDDRAEEVLAYGNHRFDMANLPCNVAWWLNQYKKQIEFLQADPKLVVGTSGQLLSTMLRANTVNQLMQTTWDQTEPYWNECPTYSGSRCYTGCVATAMAQVMKYWQFPNNLPALSGYRTDSYNINVPALSAVTLDWNNMLNSYSGSYTNAQADAVATLMRHCGQASKMDYTPYGSGAYTEDQRDAFVLFGYDSGATVVYRDQYNASDWNTMMQAELEAGRPILYGGSGGSDGSDGHAFVVDGYNANTGKYHVNFGWSGYDDDYYALDAFIGDGTNFQYYQDAVIGVYPEGDNIEKYAPVMNPAANVGSTSFKAVWTDQTPSENVEDYTLYVQSLDANTGTILKETFAGATAASTTNIASQLDDYCDNPGWTGSYVYPAEGGLRMGSSSNAGSLITPALDFSNSGGTIVVKFTANYWSSSDNTKITVTCGGANIDVQLAEGRTYYTLTYSGMPQTAGQKITFASSGGKKRFYIYDVEVIAGATSKATETGDADNLVITGITDKNYTVTGLNEGGSYKFYVEANYVDGTKRQSNVENVTLEGEVQPTPEMIVDPSTLTMNAAVGETATATFDVLGADLAGNVTLTLNDANGVFSINPSTISAANAEAGATVTVTYAPIAAGEHTATITLSSEDAQDVTVTLNGTAAMSTTAPVMAAATNVGATSFTATWTDETPAQYVTDYTLYVNKAGDVGCILLTEAFGGVTATNDGTARIEGSLDTYCDNAGWTGSYIYQAGGGGLKFGNSSNGGYLTTPALDLTNCGGAITVAFNAKAYGTDATALTISCGEVSATVNLTSTAADYEVTLSGVTAAANQQVTIASTGSRQRYYLYNVAIYNGANRTVEEVGDDHYRVITGITAKTYTVENLTPGETYNFYVVANYVDETNANSNVEQVTLVQGVVPELLVDPETLTLTAAVGETATATFEVLGANLTGGVTVTLNDENGVYTIDPASISVADAEEGATVTVTYAPLAAGEHTATITLSSDDVEDVTVTLTGTATMSTTAPVMAAATNVGTTSFTATWTDETPAQYVTDYTLYVNKAGAASDALLTENFGGVLVENDGTARIEESLDDYCDNAGWTGSYVYQAAGGGLKFGNSSNGGYLTTPALDLTDCGGTITVAFNGKNYGTDATTLTISCGDVSETVELTGEATDYTVTLSGVTAAADQYVTIASSGSKQRYYLYNVAIYNGANRAVETGDANSRVITGITAKTYTVENLTPGETYNFYVVANYVDETNANSNVEQVTLIQAVVPEIIVDSETLELTANVGETAIATFGLLAENLTGDVTVTLEDETGMFAVDPATVTVAEAEEGATITVTYAPTVAGEHTATITLSSEDAEDVTITLTGTGVMETLAPEMQPADEDYVTETSFRADWVDVTPEQYVASYTLYVNKKQDVPVGEALLTEAFGGVLVENDGTARIDESLDDYCDNAGWTGGYVYQAGGGGLKFGNSSNGGYLTTPALDLTDCGGTITVAFNAKNYGTDATTLTISCGDVSETVELTGDATDYTVTLSGVTAAADQYVTIASSGSKQRYYLYSVTITSGVAAKAVVETGDADSRVITGITDMYYVVEGLTPGATYDYYVKAIYIDQTEASSNVETVTLLEHQDPGYAIGDVNHDGFVDVDDVTALIGYVLNGVAGDNFYLDTANVDGEGGIDVDDVTRLISIVLGN